MKKKLKSTLVSLIKFSGAVNRSLRFNSYLDGIIILKIDAIGDYILVRNFFAELKKSPKFANHKITLVGNSLWKEIALQFDINVIDEFIWLDKKKKEKNKWYLINFLINLSKRRFEYAIYPAYSRDHKLGDFLMDTISAKNKITFTGDLNNMSFSEKLQGDKFYNRLITIPEDIVFEYLRNKYFFSQLLDKELTTKFEIIPIATNQGVIAQNRIIFFVGAGVLYRKWHKNKFIELAKKIYARYKTEILICGGMDDFLNWKTLNWSDYPYLINLLGQTTLVELIDMLSRAKFVVSNETSVAHLAVAVNTPVFVISNGNHFGRFTPYPKEVTQSYYVTYPAEIINELNKNNSDEVIKKFEIRSELDINLVEVNQLEEMINKEIENAN